MCYLQLHPPRGGKGSDSREEEWKGMRNGPEAEVSTHTWVLFAPEGIKKLGGFE
jgi:hypothetical protein